MDAKTIRSTSPAIPASGARIASRKRDPLRGLKWATYALILLTVGRVNDIVPALSSLPLVKIVLAYVVFAIIVNHKLLPAVVIPDNPAVKWAMAFGAWIGVSFWFSIWLGPSFNFIVGNLPVLAVVVWVICKLSGDWQSLRRLFFALFISAFVLTIPGVLNFGGGRLSVKSMYDPNDLAYVLVGIVPIALAFGMTAASRTRRFLCYGAGVMMVLTALLTGSRGGMLGLLFVVGAIILALSTLRRQRVETRVATARKPKTRATARIALSLVACVLVGIVVWSQLPPETQQRFSSLLSLESDYNLDARWGRMEIWKRSMEAIVDRPIGYGVGAFQMVDGRYGGTWLTAHNSLVLIAVELGPIGLVMYLAVIVHLWRGLTKIRRTLSQLEAPSEQQRQQAIFSRMLQASLVGNFVAGLFLSTAYFYAHWVNIALAMAFVAMFNRDKLGPTLKRKSAFAA
jgi:hypothetical protein